MDTVFTENPRAQACFPTPKAPWCNSSKTFAQRVELLVSALSAAN